MIPVLVDGARPLDTRELPPDIAALAGLQAQTVTHAKFDKDVETLIEAVGREGPIYGNAEAYRPFAYMGTPAWVVTALVAAVVHFARVGKYLRFTRPRYALPQALRCF